MVSGLKTWHRECKMGSDPLGFCGILRGEMKTRGVVNILVIVAVGLLGLAPAVVCAMPSDCPMTPQPAAAHDCCTPVAMAPCHATQTAATPAQTAPTLHSSVILPVLADAVVDAPAVMVSAAPAATPVAAVPRFLLTHAFRL